MIVIPDEGAIELLNKTLRAALVTDESYSLRLYRNDYTPAPGSTLTSFDEATFLGYYRQDLLRSGWGVPAIVTGRAESEYTEREISWTPAASGQVIYGYYVVAPLTAKVAWAERFVTPLTMGNGQPLIILPKLTGRGEV